MKPGVGLDFLAVGRLRRPHGVHGEVSMEILTDFPERLRPGLTLYLGPDHLPCKLVSRRTHNQLLLVRFEGYTTPEQAGELRNQMVYVTADDRPALPEGEFYHHQIIGLNVVDEQGTLLGQVVEMLETGANDILMIRPPSGPKFLIPWIDDVILSVDLEKGELHIHLLSGLLPSEWV